MEFSAGAAVEGAGVPAAPAGTEGAAGAAGTAGGAAAPEAAAHGGEVVRFTRWRRFEHLALMTTFILLCATGFPQKYNTAAASHWVVHMVGGLGPLRWIHRISGLVMAAMTVLHFAAAFAAIVRGRAGALGMVPGRQDFRDAVQTLRYYLGASEVQARFDRFDYRQKWEYWGVVMGTVIMVVTGFLLFLPTLATRLLPGEAIPAAKLAHSSEGLMAFLVIIIWHVYNAHLNPDVFPMDFAIFTGRVSRRRMHHEHPLELERMDREAQPPPAPPDPAPAAPAGKGAEPGAGG